MKQHLITLFCIALIGCASPQQQEQNDETMNKEYNELTAFDVQQDFRNDTPKKWYEGFEAGIHTVYVGEVIGAWRRINSML